MIIGKMTKSTCYIADLLQLYTISITVLEEKGQAGRKEGREGKKILVRRKERFPSSERNKRNSD